MCNRNSDCLQIVYNCFPNKLRFGFRFGVQQHVYSSVLSRTSMVSSPMHSILHHGMTISVAFPNPSTLPCPGKIIDVTAQSLALISISLTRPSFSPVHKLITSLHDSSVKLYNFINNHSPSVHYTHIMRILFLLMKIQPVSA